MRQKLAEALGNISTPKSISALKYLEKDTHPQVSQTARISLRNLLSPGWITPLSYETPWNIFKNRGADGVH